MISKLRALRISAVQAFALWSRIFQNFILTLHALRPKIKPWPEKEVNASRHKRLLIGLEFSDERRGVIRYAAMVSRMAKSEKIDFVYYRIPTGCHKTGKNRSSSRRDYERTR